MKKSLTPDNYPDGVWPSQYPLSLMQQFAVNSIFGQMANSAKGDILSVNGPPGTGKTTLLRDIIAAIVVDRAKKLVKIKSPDSVFTKIGEFKTGKDFKPFIYKLDEELCSTGIVISSSNNGAVENVSKELPFKKEVSPYENQMRYFREVSENCIDKENWGLISAVLGNKENRSKLVSSLWFNKNPDFNDLRKQLRTTNVSIVEWNKTVVSFNKKLDEVNKERERLGEKKKEYDKFITYLAKYEETFLQSEYFKQQLSDIKVNKDIIESEYISLKKQKENSLNELIQIKKTKPGFFTYIFNKTLRINYKKAFKKEQLNFSFLQDKLVKQNVSLINAESEFKNVSSAFQSISESLATLKNKCLFYQEKVEETKLELGGNFADDVFWKNIESKESQESCPWFSKEFKRLQSELFIVAMELHEVFILYANTASKAIETSFSAFFDYLKGNYEVKPTHKEIKALWDVFFLVIPVISTTFASVQTMFKDLEKGDLPWLFIDEAGQAVPQAAAGAIWRSKRVVVVGDPLQIEPVVTIPKSITDNIRDYFDLNETVVNSELSVQVMADRINPLGMNIANGESNIWVGIPLRVHRRCLNPMFNISNSIAYDNKMFLSTVNPEIIDLVFESAFINVSGNVQGRHWVKEHGDKVVELLIKEIHNSENLPAVFIITPFTEIRFQLNGLLFKPIIQTVKLYLPQTTANDISNWLKTHVGTVHTFQGKQADGVILCLGLDNKTKGAALWASNKPNLLNVALTRAKYRFVAVGDKDIWLNVKYFKELTYLNN